MRLTLGQKLALARSGPGRRRLGLLALGRLAVPLRRVAWLHRRTLARGVRVVAVTGSYGKSSTVRLVAAALGLPPPAAGEIPNGLWPVPAAVLRLRPGQARAVIEIGIDRPGLMDRQAGAAAPDVAIVTSVGGEHLETIGDMGRIAREKARLLAHLRRGGVAVLHGDDPRVRAMAPRTNGRVVTYGLDPGNDVHAVDVSVDWPRGMRFTAMVHGVAVPMRLPLLGRHMVPPALAALAVAAGEGLPLARAAAAIAALPPVTARLEVVPLPDGTTLLCDHHKNSLATIRAALELAAELPGRKLLVIARVREMGAEQADELRRTAELVARVPAEVIAIGEGVEAADGGGTGGWIAGGEAASCGPGHRPCAGHPARAGASRRRDPAQGTDRLEARAADPGAAGPAGGLRPRRMHAARPGLRLLPIA